MTNHRKILVTGARGFIGAWVCRLLLEEGVEVVAFDASDDPKSVDAVMTTGQSAEVQFVTGDVRNADLLDSIVGNSVTHVIHLAGMLMPASEQRPALSAEVSLGGLINVLQCATKRAGELGISYASTGAIYGPGALYPGGVITPESRPAPQKHYGVHRYMMELTAGVWASQHHVGSIGLRPWIVYGAGRFKGASAEPSVAMLAAAADKPFRIGFGGEMLVHHVRDVARAFIAAACARCTTAVAANIPAETIDMNEMLELIFQAAPLARGKITIAPVAFDIPSRLNDPTLERIIGPITSPTAARIAETVEDYRLLLSQGRVSLPSRE